MLHGENRPVTSNLAVEVIAGGFNMAVEVVGEILTSEGSVQSHSVGNAVCCIQWEMRPRFDSGNPDRR